MFLFSHSNYFHFTLPHIWSEKRAPITGWAVNNFLTPTAQLKGQQLILQTGSLDQR